MWFIDTPRRDLCSGKVTEFSLDFPWDFSLDFSLDENVFWRYQEEPAPKRDSDVQERGEETADSCSEKDEHSQYADAFGHFVQRFYGYFEELEFENKVAYQKQKIREMMFRVRNELNYLLSLLLLLTLGYRPKESSSEKTITEKILDAVTVHWVTAKQVCFMVYPWKDMSAREKELALKRIRMRLLRLSGGKKRKKKPGRPKGKLVQNIKTKGEIIYLILPEGRSRLHFLRKERIRAENNEELNKQIQVIVKEVKELVSETDQMQTYNVEAMKRLAYSLINDYVYQTSSEGLKMLNNRIVADIEEKKEYQNDSRIYSFISSIKETLKIADDQVSISDNLRIALELRKLASSK
jgi:hypothetical protein